MKIGVTIENDLEIHGASHYMLSSLIACKEVKELYLIQVEYKKINQQHWMWKYLSFQRIILATAKRFADLLMKILEYIGAYTPVNTINADDFLVDRKRIFERCAGILKVNQERKGLYSYTDADGLNDCNLDFIVRGNGLLIEKGRLLSDGHKHGLISLHHGDNKYYRGGPAGFWEVYYKDKVSAITLQKLTPELDGGEILDKAYLDTKDFFMDNHENLMRFSGLIITKYIKRFKNGKVNNSKINKHFYKNIYTGPIYKSPNAFSSLVYILLCLKKFTRLLLNRMTSVISRKVLGMQHIESWMVHVGDSQSRLEKWANSSKIDKKVWIADPFFTEVKGKKCLVFECFNQLTLRANISYCMLDKRIPRFSEIHTLIDDHKHLSYPFTFQRDNRTYCIPEAQGEGIWLYEITVKDGRLIAKKIRLLIEGNHVDPTLLHCDGIDYIFVNPIDPGGRRSILNVYMSENIIDAKIRPHDLNPIMIDTRFARSGGRIIEIDNCLYRPTQDCVGGYGQKIDISEIRISLDNFSSKFVESIVPTGKYNFLHHIDYSLDDDLLVSLDTDFVDIRH